MERIQETLDTPVLGQYDVIVCGGGVAGVAAAAAAARSHASVLLIEKTIHLGGLATIGLISWYEPLCDGNGHKLMHGMATELLQLAIRGGNTLPDGWRTDPDEGEKDRRYSTFFSPTWFSMLLDQWVQDAGVKILLDTLVVKPVMNHKLCSGIVVENKTGRGCYRCKAVVDATGDAELAYKAGIPCVNGKNYLTFIGYLVNNETCEKAVTRGFMLDARRWVKVGADLWGRGHPDNYPLISGTTAEEITDFVLSGRKMWFGEMTSERGCDAAALPGMAQLRTIRRIQGNRILTEADQGKACETSIALSSDFANRGKWYEIPYESLISNDCDNLLAAGRIIASEGWAWEVTRVIPAAVATGQAAGTAAAMCATTGKAVYDLDYHRISSSLHTQGVTLHYSEIEERIRG